MMMMSRQIRIDQVTLVMLPKPTLAEPIVSAILVPSEVTPETLPVCGFPFVSL